MPSKREALLLLVIIMAGFIGGRLSVVDRPAPKTITWPRDPVCQHTIGDIEFRSNVFFDQLKTLIEDSDFADASGLLIRANVEDIVAEYPNVYVAIPSDENLGFTLPGVDMDYDESKDVILPGAASFISWQWVQYCRLFAEKYNVAVSRSLVPSNSGNEETASGSGAVEEKKEEKKEERDTLRKEYTDPTLIDE